LHPRQWAIIETLGYWHKFSKAHAARNLGADPQRILLMLMGDIADIVRMTPLVKAVRRRYPAAHIVALATEGGLAAIQACPYVNQVLPWRRSSTGGLSFRYLWNKVIECAALSLRLRGKFDLVIGATGGNPLPNIVTFATGAPWTVGYDLFHTGFLLSDNLGRKQWGLQEEDLTAQLLEAINASEPSGEDSYMEVWPAADEDRIAGSLLEKEGIAEDNVLVAICPGSDWSCQQWHLSNWAAVGDALARRYGAQMIVVGLEREKSSAERLACMMKHKPIDLTGRTTVGQLAGVLRRCSLALTLESAPCAISVAVGTPTVALFGAIGAWVRGRHRAPVAIMTQREGTPPSCYTLCKKSKMESGVRRCENELCIAGDGLMSISPGNVLCEAESLLYGALMNTKYRRGEDVHRDQCFRLH
jgi:ADP-heptose:LPS heptosyltransferase